MYILPVILFCAGIVLGGLHGYFLGHTVLDIFFSFAVGGFLGSTVGVAAFIYTYISQQRQEARKTANDYETLTPLPLHTPKALPRSMHIPKDLPRHSPRPEQRPSISPDIPQPGTIPPDDHVQASKAGQIQRLEKEINALKNKKRKGN